MLFCFGAATSGGLSFSCLAFGQKSKADYLMRPKQAQTGQIDTVYCIRVFEYHPLLGHIEEELGEI